VREVRVRLGERSYSVAVGHGARRGIAAHLPGSARRVAVITQHNVPAGLIPDLGGRETTVLRVGDGESHKTLQTVGELCSSMARAGLTRDDAVVGVGGGMVTDLAGFVAASYHRGVTVAHVATTLLAMIDASVGGKTGVNLPEGKNLVGAFWQPVHVACDLDALETLPERETRCGLGEMAKYDFIAGSSVSRMETEERIAACIDIKASIVSEDERESGRRALLNYGHTLGHALEAWSGFVLAHGEAVAVGLLYAAEVAAVTGRIGPERVADHYRIVLDEYGLGPGFGSGIDGGTGVALPEPEDFPVLLDLMSRDKKAKDGLTFVLDGPIGLEVVSQVDPTDLRRAWLELSQKLGALQAGADYR